MNAIVSLKFRRAIASLCAAVLLLPTAELAFGQQKQTPHSSLTEAQRILHVLNRLGFGARPGDIERVKAMGVDRYIEQQLHPETISDAIVQAKIKEFATLSMSTAELYAKYPRPGRLLRQLERRGELPTDLAEARKSRNAASQTLDTANQTMETENAPESNRQNARDNREYRRALREYYAANGLELPQRIVADLHAAKIVRAVYSEKQLQEVMVDFWTNHFNVFAGKGADRWLLVSYDRDTIRPNALGKFSDLLRATAQSPAMLFYLDNFQSVSPNAGAGRPPNQRRASVVGLARQDRLNAATTQSGDAAPETVPQRARRGINENYARELMELHTLGVDGGYTQKDVQEVARCFTGWTIFAPRGAGVGGQGRIGEMARERAGTFFFNPRVHDDGEKTVLGQKIASGGGMKDGLMVLDLLAKHPSTAKFIAQKLVTYFVSDEPPAGLVDRVAATFTKSGGDIRDTLRVIFLSPEFNSPEAYRAKIKRPFELAVSAVRTLGADTNGGPQFHQWIAKMGEPLYGYQTPNGYSDTAESWVNTGGLLERLNFGLALASNQIRGTRVDLKQFLANGDSSNSTVLSRFVEVIVGGDISAKTKEALLKQLSESHSAEPPSREDSSGQMGDRKAEIASARQRERSANSGRDLPGGQINESDRVSRIVGLILGSPEFQKQ